MNDSSKIENLNAQKQQDMKKTEYISIKPVAEQLSEEVLSLHAQLLNTIEQSVIATDLGGIVIYWNRFAEQIYGWSAEEAIGRNVGKLIMPKTSIRQADEIMTQLRQDKSWTGELTVQRKDGTTFPAQITNSPIYDKQTLIGIIGLSNDITERKLMEKALRVSESRYRSLLENANDIIYSHDLQGNYVAVNSAAEKVTGYSREELKEMNIAQLVVPEHHELVKQIIERKLCDPTPTVHELDIITKDGRRRTLEVNPRVSSIEGQPLVIEGVARDVTERKHLEEVRHTWAERLEAAREGERRRLSLQLHDEVVQQLAVASIKLQQLEKRLVKLLPEENAVFADLVMTEELLHRNQQSLRQMAYVLHSGVLEQFGLAEAFRKFTKDIDTLLLKQSTAISLDLSPDFPRLESAIENGIYRTVQEAINNALKHARAKLISLSLGIKDDLALVIIRDDGCGFDLKKIESSGIGVASMYERAEIIGAKLNITSQKGKGTTVTLEAPLKQCGRKAQAVRH